MSISISGVIKDITTPTIKQESVASKTEAIPAAAVTPAAKVTISTAAGDAEHDGDSH